jgi:putative tryptophan/tyrosine transport system substrate-binding protein
MTEHLHSGRRVPTRRAALRLAAGGLLAPVAAWGQEAGRTYRLGVISFTPHSSATFVGLFEALARAGFVEGRNLTVDPQGFEVTPGRLREVAEAVVAKAPDAIVCGGDPVARAALQATKTIPIVANCDDLVRNGLVASLARPGGNLTGVSILATELDGKRQQLLTDLIPGIRRLATLAYLSTRAPDRLAVLQKAAAAGGIELAIYQIAKAAEIAPAIDEARAKGAQALNVLASALFHANHRELIERVAAAKLPAMFQWPEYVEEGALAGYGPRLAPIYAHQIARQLVKVLRGTKPADIPAEQPTDMELGINLQTAEKLGLEVPESFLTRADQVIR